MVYNKIITSEGNVQFQTADGNIINVHPFHIYTTFNEDTVSFILIAMPKSSGLAIFTSKASDLEVNGTVYTIEQLPNALSEAFAKAGAVARYEIVDELPTSGQSNTIYLVPKEDGEGYDEYIYVNGEWELIGDTDIELDRYVDKETFSGYTADTLVLINTVSGNVITESERAISAETALQTAINGKQDTLIAGSGITISGNVISAEGGGGIDSGAVETMIEDYMTDTNYVSYSALTNNLATSYSGITRWNPENTSFNIINTYSIGGQGYVIPSGPNYYGEKRLWVSNTQISDDFKEYTKYNGIVGSIGGQSILLFALKAEYANTIPSIYKSKEIWYGFNEIPRSPKFLDEISGFVGGSSYVGAPTTYENVSGCTYLVFNMANDLESLAANNPLDFSGLEIDDMHRLLISCDGIDHSYYTNENIGFYLVSINLWYNSVGNKYVVTPLLNENFKNPVDDGYGNINAIYDLAMDKTYEGSDFTSVYTKVSSAQTTANSGLTTANQALNIANNANTKANTQVDWNQNDSGTSNVDYIKNRPMWCEKVYTDNIYESETIMRYGLNDYEVVLDSPLTLGDGIKVVYKSEYDTSTGQTMFTDTIKANSGTVPSGSYYAGTYDPMGWNTSYMWSNDLQTWYVTSSRFDWQSKLYMKKGSDLYHKLDSNYIDNDIARVTEIQTALDAKVNTSDFNTYSASTQTAINGKQDTLVAGSGITISGNVISAEGSGSIDSGAVETMIEDYMTDDSLQIEAYSVQIDTAQALSTMFGLNLGSNTIYTRYNGTRNLAPNIIDGKKFNINQSNSSFSEVLKNKFNIPTSATLELAKLGFIVKSNFYNKIPSVFKADDYSAVIWLGLNGYITEPKDMSDVIPSWDSSYENGNYMRFSAASASTMAVMFPHVNYQLLRTSADWDFGTNYNITLSGYEDETQYGDYIGEYVVMWTFMKQNPSDPMNPTRYYIITPIANGGYDVVQTTDYTQFKYNMSIEKTYDSSDLSNLTTSIEHLNTSANTLINESQGAVYKDVRKSGSGHYYSLSKINNVNLFTNTNGHQMIDTHTIASVNGQNIFISGNTSGYTPVDIDVRGDWSVSDSTSKNYIKNKPTITSAVTSASTDSEIPTAKAVYDKLGGLSLVKLTQAEYDALSPNYDSDTLYVVTDS